MPVSDNGNGHELVVSECRSQPADTRWLARLQALDCNALSQRIASCERPQEAHTILKEIKSLQEICACFLAEVYEKRVELFRLEVEARCKLQEIFDGMETAPGRRGNGIITRRGKLFELHDLGIEFKQAYKYREILRLRPAEIENFITTCAADHRVPTTNGLLNATRKRQMLERTVRDRPWTEDRGALFGCDHIEGNPSAIASAHETIRQSSEEERGALVLALMDEMPPPYRRLIRGLSDEDRHEFVQRYYERRGRPAEQRRLFARLMAAVEAESNAQTNSSERDETTQPEIAVAIPAGTDDAATVN